GIGARAARGAQRHAPSRAVPDDLRGACIGPRGHAALREAAPDAGIDGLRRRFDERQPDGDYLAWMSYASLKTRLAEDFLKRLDTMGMRHSVEGRVPLLDSGLARWALALPHSVKVPGFRQKALLREAVAPLLPGYVLARPKQ